jgi:hypothetical protein
LMCHWLKDSIDIAPSLPIVGPMARTIKAIGTYKHSSMPSALYALQHCKFLLVSLGLFAYFSLMTAGPELSSWGEGTGYTDIPVLLLYDLASEYI